MSVKWCNVCDIYHSPLCKGEAKYKLLICDQCQTVHSQDKCPECERRETKPNSVGIKCEDEMALDRIYNKESVLYKEIWNAAIEAAALIAAPINLNAMPEECRTDIEKLAHDVRQLIMENIRKLKK